MPVKLTNNATAKLASSITNAQATITLEPGRGAAFPQPNVEAGDWFPLTVFDAQGNVEIMRCTARASDTLTVARGTEGTAPRVFAAGDKVELRLTAGTLAALQEEFAAADTALKQHADTGIAKAKEDAAAAATAAAAAQATADEAKKTADTAKAEADKKLNSSRITIKTEAPTGGADGDLWFQP